MPRSVTEAPALHRSGQQHDADDRLVRPIFVVGSPRSGTTLLQNVLCRDPSLFRLGRESRFLWHRLGGQEITGMFPGRAAVVQAYLAEVFRDEHPWTATQQRRWAMRCASQGVPAQYLDLPHELLTELAEPTVVGPFAGTEQTETAPFTLPPRNATYATDTSGEVRMVDKDTGHCWRLPELAQAFPDAQFIFIVRDPADAVRSLIAGWRHPSWFFTYRITEPLQIDGYSDEYPWGRHWWNFNLFPGYQDLVAASVEEVCLEQWLAAVRPVMEHGVPLVDQGRAVFTSFERLVADPAAVLGAISDFTGLAAEAVIADGLGKTYMAMAAETWNPREHNLSAGVQRARESLSPIMALLDAY